MVIEKKAFVRYDLDKKADTLTIKLNTEERQLLESLKYIIHQEKDGTAIKQLSLGIAAKVLLDDKTKAILGVVLNNYRKNKRLGVVNFD